MSSISSASQTDAAAAYQVTLEATMPVGLTPPVVVVTGAVPVTGDPGVTSNWFFLTILVVVGLLFIVAIAALLRRPYP